MGIPKVNRRIAADSLKSDRRGFAHLQA